MFILGNFGSCKWKLINLINVLTGSFQGNSSFLLSVQIVIEFVQLRGKNSQKVIFNTRL